MGECTWRVFTGDIGGCSTAPMAVGAAFMCTWGGGRCHVAGKPLKDQRRHPMRGAAASIYYGTRRSIDTCPLRPSERFNPNEKPYSAEQSSAAALPRGLSRAGCLRTVLTGNRAWADAGDSGEAAPVGKGPRSGRPARASSSSESTWQANTQLVSRGYYVIQRSTS